MKHPRTRTERSLIGMALVLLGLSTYGCGDTGTSTQPAELGSLSASAGILEPKFNPATTAYTVKLFGNESSTTITVSPRVAGDSVQIDNQRRTSQTVTLAAIGDKDALNIVVTDTGAGGTSKTYAVEVRREEEDTRLGALFSSTGTVAPSPFDKSKLDPSINGIDTSVTNITLTATKSDPNTVMVIEVPTNPITVPAGIASGDAPVQLGGTGSATKVPIVITGPKGGKTTYVVTINRGASKNSFLKSLTVSPGEILDFKAGTTTYEVNVVSGAETVKVTATPEDPTANISFLVKDVATNPQSIPLLGPDSTTSIKVRVTAQDGTTQTDYTINVKRAALNGNNNLKSLSIAPWKLDFKVNQPTYNVDVPSGVETVKVTATPQESTANISFLVKDVARNPQSITLLGPGETTPITVRVTAQNGRSQDYTINVKRAALNGNANLNSLTVSPGRLSFDPADLDYNVSLLSDVTSVRITAAPEAGSASVTINGQPSPTNITIGDPGPEIRITVQVVVTAENTRDKKTYSIFFIRAALGGNFNLEDLTVTGHTLSRQSDTRYTLEVDNNVDRITVNARPQDSGASVGLFISGTQRTNPISLPTGPSTTEIEIRVTAPNGAPKSYFITVTRKAPSSNNNLSALSVAAGSVNHPVNLSTPPYTVTVAADTVNVTVTATLEDTNATMEINGQGTSSGVASAPITLVGSDTNIPIVVIAVNGDRKDYTLTVKKAAADQKPEKPDAAPDLLTADDSCPLKPLSVGNETFTNDDCARPEPTPEDPNPAPFGTRDDNKTTVKRPRFTIPQPTAGTPSLYVGTHKDTFDPGTTTLTPSVDLSEGNNTITYTLTNAGGESDPSPSLTVTFDASSPVR